MSRARQKNDDAIWSISTRSRIWCRRSMHCCTASSAAAHATQSQKIEPGEAGAHARITARLEADGARVVFVSHQSLVSVDTNDNYDVYLRDLDAQTTTVVSVSPSSASR